MSSRRVMRVVVRAGLLGLLVALGPAFVLEDWAQSADPGNALDLATMLLGVGSLGVLVTVGYIAALTPQRTPTVRPARDWHPPLWPYLVLPSLCLLMAVAEPVAWHADPYSGIGAALTVGVEAFGLPWSLLPYLVPPHSTALYE